MIQNTFSWYNGEIFEGKFILAFGIFLILAALTFNYLGNLPSAKALLWPLLVIGAIFTTIGIGGVYSNSKKIARIENEYKQDREKFIKREIKRVEDFQYLYPMSIAISLGCFLIALTVLYFTKIFIFMLLPWL